MSSETETTKLPGESGASKEAPAETLVVNVRIEKASEKLVRRAAVELDITRSEFMAEAAIERAREVLRNRRAADSAA